ncbi:hypothetical protein NBT05_07315 [Aquimarina sp. ERC-38]|uniref:hypothetical protein n=1 Tax=Aquimarina sp. ERC-38 TaxID=2949996 RepID=UPI0022451455|nr:hypothetical protein [Aquimarina sp. ERC-38]UZO82277.1 hypothetical protein NBT05_07315 [Aquimarina sp. ERC-38]
MRNLVIAVAILWGLQSFAQENSLKNDIIMAQDGQILQVKVTKVTDNTISFTYPGESVTNEINSKGVDKIIFANGRTQNFGSKEGNTSQVQAQVVSPKVEKTAPVTVVPGTNTTDQSASIYSDFIEEKAPELPLFTKKTMAIIPVKFTKGKLYDKTLSKDATDLMVSLTSQKAATSGIKVLGKEDVIKKLLAAGINYEKLRNSSPQELRKVLGTEYLLYVTLEEKEKGEEANPTTSLGYDFLSSEEKVATSASDKKQTELSANLRVYDADSEVEAYEVDFFETIFKRSPSTLNTNVGISNKWKSSLRYLTDQLYTSKVFMGL